MIDIPNVFQRRDNEFSKETKVILNALTHVVEAANQYILNYNSDITNLATEIKWEGVHFIDGSVMLIGSMSYLPGTSIMSQGQMVTITEENTDLHQQLLRLSIPETIVETGSTEDVTDFLVHAADKLADVTEQLEAATDEPDTVNDPPTLHGFDLSELSTDQLMSIPTTDGKKSIN